MTNVQEIAVQVAEFRVLYDKPPLPVQALTAYARELAALDAEKVANAFRAWMSGPEGSYWPNPGRIIAQHTAATTTAVMPSTAFDEIMTVVREARYVEAGPPRTHFYLDKLSPVLHTAFKSHGGDHFFRYLAESRYGFERNRVKETVQSLMDMEQARARESVTYVTGERPESIHSAERIDVLPKPGGGR